MTLENEDENYIPEPQVEEDKPASDLAKSFHLGDLEGHGSVDVSSRTLTGGLAYQHNGLDIKFHGNAGYNEGFTHNLGFSYNQSLSDDKTPNHMRISTDVTETDNKINGNVSINGAANIGGVDVSSNMSASLNDGMPNHDVNVSLAEEFNSGVQANADIHNDRNDSSLVIGVRKPLINMNNINGTKDDYKERKEELQQSQERFNLRTKVGYSNESESFYTENSLMYRINDNNFLNSFYNQNADGTNMGLTADLKKLKLDYSFSDNTNMTTHSLNFSSKHPKNIYNAQISHSSINQDPNAETIHNTEFGVGGQWNRTEYGDFAPGFSGAVNGAMSLNGNRVTGYKVDADASFNKYGFGMNSSDFLLQAKAGYEKQESGNTLSTSLASAYRINDCRTIFEPKVAYSVTNNQGANNKLFTSSLGVYQQLGKKFDDASIYLIGEYGRNWDRQAGAPLEQGNFARVHAGAKVKATDKVSLGMDTTYGSDKKWSGNLNLRYSF